MASAEHGSHLPVRSTDPDGTSAKDLASEDILEILRMILAGTSLKEVLTSVARVIESHREGMLCSVWLLDQDRVHMRAIAAPTLPESYLAALDGFAVGPQGGSCGAAVNQRKPVFVSDVLTDPILEQVRDIIAAHGIRACWSAPIISHQGEILGTFAFYFRSVRSPSPRDIHLIENATSIAGIAIERKKAEENLRRSEWSLLEAQRLGHSGSWSLDVSSGIVTTSPEMLRSFDVKPGDDCSSPDFWFNRIHPEDRKRVRDLFERCVMEKTDYEAHYRLLLPDGTIKYQHSIGRPIVNEKGDLVEFVGTAIDVTEQAQARIELEKAFEEIKQRTEVARRSEREFRDVVNTVPAHVWSTSPEGQVDFVNDRWLQFTGLSSDEAFGWKWEAVLHPDDRTRVVADWHTAVKNGQAMESEARVRRADGEYCWWFIRNVPLRDETGKLVRWYGTAINIEDRKRAEQALRKSEAYLAEAHRLAKTGSWAYSPAAEKCIYWSDEMRRIFGLNPQRSKLPDRDEFLRLVHPEDRDTFNERIDKAFREKADFVQDYRIVLTDGTVKHIHGIGHPVLDETGNIIEYVGTDVDVTERKRAEDALRSHEQNLRLLVDTIPGLVVTTTPAGEIEHLNRQVLEYFEKTPEELANWRTSDAIHPDDLPLTIAALTRSIQTGEPYEVEHHLRRADGVYRWFHARGLALRDKEGRIVRWYYLLTDVDDRRRAEEALRKSEALLHEAQRLARTGSWSWDVLSGRVVGSPENARIYGFQPNEDSAAPEVYFQRIHPDHRERIREVFQTCVVEKTDYQADFPIVLLDGTVKYIHATGHPILNKSGDLIEFFGTTVDVTEQHEARAALQTAFEQIKAEETELRRMTDAIASFIYVFRPDGTALYANQVVLDYTGLTLEDVQREDFPARIFHPEDVERLLEKRHDVLARGKPFELEKRELGRDGKYRWFLVRYNPLRDDQGNIIRWYATGTDIEDRKQAEERMRDENVALREQIDQAFMFEEIVGASPALQSVLSNIVKVAPTDSTVLITGETGTGKELIARAIHKHSQRSGQAFISVNCASIPSSLIASELFGHEKGAFTGAVQRRQGRFEMAHSGTIFLDEVGELPAETQIALLRVLQERQFERVGGNRTLPTDVRVIAATNRDLKAAIAAGTFRADLFYRLNVFPIEVPPLRKRREDIPMLVEYFVKRYAEKAGKQIRKIDRNTLEQCQSYSWPGNIRELQNIVERSVILSSGDTFWIEKAWLASQEATRQELPGPLPDTLQYQERKMIETALAESKGKVAGREGAAAKLGIPRSTLETKIRQLGIKKHRFISKE
jgi:PAS domain S-box-containing protein